MNNINLLYVDLFCGAGGTSTGVESARINGEQCAKIIACVNHDTNAIVNKNAVKVIGVSSGGLKGKLVNYNKIVHFHPTWETAYYNEKWEFIKDYRTK